MTFQPCHVEHIGGPVTARRFKVRTLLTGLMACLILGSILWGMYLWGAYQFEQSLGERDKGRVELFAELFGRDFRAAAVDIRMLAENSALRDFLDAGGSGPLARLTGEMALLSQNHAEYGKIRFIDESGQERVRINLGGKIEPAAGLELKGNRPYFREAFPLPAGEIYLSAFDLDVEKGVVEQPFKPTLRFAAPVFDSEGRRRGVVVISYLGKYILDGFQKFAPLYHDRLRVLNAGGFWLRGAQSGDEWGFMVPERAERTLAITAAAMWTEIGVRDEGQSRGLGGLFTWRRISPAKMVNVAGVPVRAADPYLVIASDITAASWQEAMLPLKQRYAILAVLLLVLTATGTFLFCSRREANERLSLADQRNAALIRAANIAVIATNASGIITDFNPTAERLLGWSASELIGNHTPSIFYDAEEIEGRAKQLSAEFARTVVPGFDVFALKALQEGAEEREWTAIRKDGQRLPVWLSISLLHDGQGGVIGYLGVASDLTERKQVEKALREASAAAEESARLKSQFLANMSHEIRTPMNGVVGMTGLLLDTALTDDQRLLANTVRTSADSLLTIINDILDFSKIEAGHITFDAQPFNVSEPVEGCLAMMAERAQEKSLEIAYFIEEGVPPRLLGDSGRIHQVLLNLVGNAIKFTARGEVIVNVTKVSEQHHRARLRFAVRDTGPGLSAEQQARLFQPFVQADSSTTRQFGGTGLGLAISKQLVGLMHGEVGIESEPDKGSTFWFTVDLPIAKAEPAIILNRAGLAGRRALVADDNGTNREILRRQLAGWGIDATTVADGEQAFAALREATASGAPYDVAVLDMQMPGMTGLEAAQRVHSDSSFANLKMIILTSIGHTLTRRELDEAGVSKCLVKPVRQSQLHDTLVTLVCGSPAIIAVPARRQQRLPTITRGGDLKLRILIAEDNLVNQHVARRQLEKFGYEPDIVANGAKAVEAARAHPYDVIFMDCQMPELDGFEATGRIREWEQERRARGETVAPLHIVAMTANSMAGDREACLAAGMTDYVSKPLHLNDLVAALARSPAAQMQTVRPAVA